MITPDIRSDLTETSLEMAIEKIYPNNLDRRSTLYLVVSEENAYYAGYYTAQFKLKGALVLPAGAMCNSDAWMVAGEFGVEYFDLGA